MSERRSRSATEWSAVGLEQLCEVLSPTTLAPRVAGSTLIATHEHYTVRVEVVEPRVSDADVVPIRAVVRVLSEVPAPLKPLLTQGHAELNRLACLGALTDWQGEPFVGSRVTLYEAEDAWAARYLPLVSFATISGAEPILGGLRRSLSVGGAPRRPERSEWKAREFGELERFLGSMGVVCSSGGPGLTAEFQLQPTAGSGAAALEPTSTALFQMITEQPHPEVGGGLMCVLQMPHGASGRDELHEACAALNRRELEADDLPPHFGAWCPGPLEGAPAYVSFLPNVLHGVPRLAQSAALWAAARATWADGVLKQLGVER